MLKTIASETKIEREIEAVILQGVMSKISKGYNTQPTQESNHRLNKRDDDDESILCSPINKGKNILRGRYQQCLLINKTLNLLMKLHQKKKHRYFGG